MQIRSLVCVAILNVVAFGATAPPPAPKAISVVINSANVTLHPGEQRDFTATVSNASDKTLIWSVDGVPGGNATYGTITAQGVFHAPAAVPPANVVAIKAASKADPTKTATASATLLQPVPTVASLTPATVNTNLPFTLVIKGANFTPTASASLADGTALSVVARSSTALTVTGKTVSPAGATVALTVQNPGPGPSASSPKNLAVSGAIVLTVTPAAPTLRGGASVRFTAHVENAVNKTVVWSVNGTAGGNAAVGTVATDGTYTAPVVLPGSAVTVKAVSVEDGTKSATATPNLLNPLPVLSSVTTPIKSNTSTTVTLQGTGFARGAQIVVSGVARAATWLSSTQLTFTGIFNPPVGGTLSVAVQNPAPGAGTSNVLPMQVNNSGSKLSYSDARRFLEHATWGPTPAAIEHLQAVGVTAWLNEQFDPSQSPVSSYDLPVDQTSGITTLQEQFFRNALVGKDQLRQRVAFALGQVLVVSNVKLSTYDQMMPFEQILLNDAFGKYHDLLRDVTLSPAMGHYLDMVNNDRPANGKAADENYAREVMQLFSIGLSPLNADATRGGAPGAVTYTQDDISALAKILTGWTYAPCFGTSKWTNNACFDAPMVSFDEHHDTTAKTFLGIPFQGGTAASDLELALSTIESYKGAGETIPNIAPFVSLRLIQHLVTSNPAPDYVARVAAVYANSGGDLKQVVQAVLTDVGAWSTSATAGHLREPVYYAVSLLRALNAQAVYAPPLMNQTAGMGQDLFRPGSVFNYYSPFYRLPGTPIAGPEFQLLNQSTAFYRANYAFRAVTNSISSAIYLNVDNWAKLAADSNPNTQNASLTTMMNAVSTALLGTPMPPAMQQAVLPALVATSDPVARARTAVYLVAASPEYQVVQ